MMLNTKDWGEFRIGNIFIVKNGKGLTIEEIDDHRGTLYCIQGGESNNGSIGKINRLYCYQKGYLIIDEPCLTVARVGTAGCVNYWDESCAIGDKCKALLLKDHKTPEIYLFMQSILNQLQYKYSYGRGLVTEKYVSEIINLPILHNSDDSPYIDTSCKYSDEGYVPDWKFMEDYIKSLHYKPLTTQNKSGQTPKLNVQRWGEFRITEIFEITKAYAYNQDTFEPYTDDDENLINCITRTANNNGCDYKGIYSDSLLIESGNALTIGGEGVVCFYQKSPFVCGTNMTVLRSQYLNEYNGLFISRVIDCYSSERFCYGRAFNMQQIKKSIIKLPQTSSGDPDWQFMEDYIKSLPYGDKLPA